MIKSLCEYDGGKGGGSSAPSRAPSRETAWQTPRKAAPQTALSNSRKKEEDAEVYEPGDDGSIPPLNPPFPYRAIAPDFDFFNFSANPPTSLSKEG